MDVLKQKVKKNRCSLFWNWRRTAVSETSSRTIPDTSKDVLLKYTVEYSQVGQTQEHASQMAESGSNAKRRVTTKSDIWCLCMEDLFILPIRKVKKELNQNLYLPLTKTTTAYYDKKK